MTRLLQQLRHLSLFPKRAPAASTPVAISNLAAPEQTKPSTDSNQQIPFQLHGSGLASYHQQKEHTPEWRIKFSEFLTQKVMSHRQSRCMLASKKMYIQADALTPALLSFFYSKLQYPVTFQSWFLLTQLHVWMCQSRLRQQGSDGQLMSKALLDMLTTDLELKLWATGVNNPRVQDKYMHELLSTHYGCSLAYDEGYEGSDALLASALWRNIFSMDEQVDPQRLHDLVRYVRFQTGRVFKIPEEKLVMGEVKWSLPPPLVQPNPTVITSPQSKSQ